MKKCESLMLAFQDKEGKLLPERKLTSVPLREDTLLRLSVEYFNDPEPCMIHRSAVMSRMYMELLEYFLAAAKKGQMMHKVQDIPYRLAAYMDMPGFVQINVTHIMF